MLQPGDIVIVGFPYADRAQEKYRPALIVSNATFHARHGLCWVVMITSDTNASWEGDVPLPQKSTGLRKASVIRTTKLVTLDLATVDKIGSATPAIMKKVKHCLQDALA